VEKVGANLFVVKDLVRFTIYRKI